MNAPQTALAEVPRVHLSVLSNSAIACYRACPREFQLRYVKKRRPRSNTEALRFGSFFHCGLNAWWSENGEVVSRVSASIRAMRARAASKPEDANPFDLVKAEELILGYTVRWGEEKYETLEVEKQFDMPLVNPATGHASKTYRIQGAIDVLAMKDGKYVHVEHKTTASDITPGADYWRKVSALDSQVSTYQAALKSLGIDAETLYDVVRKVTLVPFKETPDEQKKYKQEKRGGGGGGELYASQHAHDETPEEFRIRVRERIASKPEHYYARGPIVRLEQDEREHAADVWMTASMIRLSENGGTWPRNPGACERFHTLCSYFDVCSGNASIDDESRFRTAERAHEELTIKEV